jgi:hypothetical protein
VTVEELITCLQSTGICMYKTGKLSPNILIWRFLLQDRQDGQQNEIGGRIPRLRRARTSKQHKYYDNYWHNCRSATDIVFTKSKVKPNMQSMNYHFTKHTNKNLQIWGKAEILQTLRKNEMRRTHPERESDHMIEQLLKKNPIWFPSKDTMLLEQQSHGNLGKTFQ